VEFGLYKAAPCVDFTDIKIHFSERFVGVRATEDPQPNFCGGQDPRGIGAYVYNPNMYAANHRNVQQHPICSKACSALETTS